MVFRSLWLNPDQTRTPAYRGCGLAPPTAQKKADVAENPKVYGHVGLLFNKPPG
jgi:hypothetical protein